MKPIFRTIAFWVCVVLTLTNLFLFFVSKALNDQEGMKLNLLSMTVCALGASLHWHADRLLRKEEEKK